MSKIDELIEKLCPDGVKKCKIKEICNVTIGEFVHKNKQRDDAAYPVYNGGISNTGFYDEYNNDGNMIIISARGANAGFVNKIEGKYWAGNSCYSLDIKDKKNNNFTFIYYSIKNNEMKLLGEQQKGSIPAISKKQIEEFEIPVPPLEVQREIVHILDDFTLLSAELSAELKARQKQFEYYRTKLLSIDGKNYKLGEIADFKTGVKPKNILEQSQYEYINVGTTNSGYTESKNFKGDVVITPSRGQGGIGFVGYQKDEFWLGPLCYAIWSKNEKILINKYLYYELSSKKDEILKRKNTGGVPSLNGCDLKTIQLNVPSLKEQEKIVNILDKFEKICENISSGLPAEIEARKKQYEYYRDKLLTFKELKVKE